MSHGIAMQSAPSRTPMMQVIRSKERHGMIAHALLFRSSVAWPTYWLSHESSALVFQKRSVAPKRTEISKQTPALRSGAFAPIFLRLRVSLPRCILARCRCTSMIHTVKVSDLLSERSALWCLSFSLRQARWAYILLLISNRKLPNISPDRLDPSNTPCLLR